MTRYADPHRCPDCHGPIGFDDLTCPSCGLPLRGTTAAELFRTLSTADVLLSRLRAAAQTPVPGAVAAGRPSDALVTAGVGVAAAASAGGTATAPVGSTAPDGPGGPVWPGPAGLPRGPRSGLSAASVPKILLALGAACLLVAALVFLAVTWSVMGVGGRTATLVGFTAVAGALAAWMARRDLRGAAESLSLVALGLLTMDVFGARSAGWFGDLSTPAFLVLLGAVLAATGASATLATRRTPVAALVVPELVAGAGVLLATVGIADYDADLTAATTVAATLAAAGATAVAARLRLSFTAAVSAVAAVLGWTGQLLDALEAVEQATLGALWGDLQVGRLLVSAALVGAVALVRALPVPVRVGAAAVGLLVLAFALTLPALDESPTSLALAALVAAVAAGLVAWLLPRPWGLSGVLVQAVAALGLLVALLVVVGAAAERLAETGAAAWSGRTGDLLPAGLPDGVPGPWLAPLVVLALLGTGSALTRASATLDAALSAVTNLRLGAALLAGSVALALACYPVPVWSVLAVLVLAAAGFLAWWLVRPGLLGLAVTAVFLAGAVEVGAYDEWLTVAALTALLAAAGLVHLRAAGVEVAAVAGSVVPVSVAGLAWTWGALVDGRGPWVALVGLLLVAALLLTVHLYPASWWASGAGAARTGVEAGALMAAAPLAAAGVATAGHSMQSTWTAVYLTVAGAALVAASVLRADRRPLAWPGAGLLVLASWVRLADLDVAEPEAYTLPAALALVVVGLVRLRRDPGADTMSTLSPGLTLALTPSLVWALPDPVTLRGLLLGLACLALVLAALGLRWSAPLVVGALVGGVLVVVMAAPYVGDAVPRWVLIGGAGALLIATGITWERRLQEARHLVGYVKTLR